MDRTSLFIAFFLSVVAIHGAAHAPLMAARKAATAVLWASLGIFALAFHPTYFRIWDFDLDTDRGFDAFKQYIKDHPVESAGCTWRYEGAYNFYRLESSADVPKCDYIDQEQPPPRSVYFLHTRGQAEFIAKAKLNIIYQGPASGLIVGVSPAK